MPFEPKNYDHLIGTPGFSDQMLKNHFTLYQGYITNTNKISDEIRAMVSDGKLGTPQYAELKRRFGWEFNGMRLHELYFGNMAKQGNELAGDAPLRQHLSFKFGSYDVWKKGFQTVGAMRGIGWTILYYDPASSEFFNVWVNEHDVGHLAGAVPLLVLDVFEHAYTLDYGIKKADYIEAFFSAIDWKEVAKRFSERMPGIQ